MIGYVKGKIDTIDPTFVVVDVNGIGYTIKISLNTYSAIKEKIDCKLFTHLHVKEDAHTLFGFHDPEERTRFLELIGISGVGPGTALMILSSLSADELQYAIVNEEVKTIQSVKGIGAKTANRIILELKDKMKKQDLLNKSLDSFPSLDNTLRNEALSALVTLGINKSEADKKIRIALKNSDGNITLEQLIKIVLKGA
ncbi:MAG TPA: Holliday junction branch migration protein RuvA [Cyclobacteriaceae bacterium]